VANLFRSLISRRPTDEVARFSTQDYLRWLSSAWNGLVQPMYPSTSTYSQGRPAERIENSFTGYVYGAYKVNPIVYGLMTRRSSVFSEARFMWREVLDGKPGDLFWNDTLQVLSRPWPNGTTGELLTRMIQDVDLAGNCYIVNEGDRLRRLRPDWVQIILSGNPLTDPDVDVVGYTFTPGGPDAGEPVPYMPDEVCHWSPIPDPDAQYRGMSWLTPVVREIQGDQAATSHKLAFYRNGATLGPIVKLPKEMTPEQFKKFIQADREAHAGAENAYSTMYIGGGADVTLAAANMQQLDFKAVQGAGETRLCVASGVPAVIAGVSEGLSGSSLNAGNYGTAKRSFADGTLRTLWRSACAALSTILEVPDDAELWYDESHIAFLREDQQDQAQIDQTTMATIVSGITGGFEPATVVATVRPQWSKSLQHSGLMSVQLTPPGSEPTDTVDGTDVPPPDDGVPPDQARSQADLDDELDEVLWALDEVIERSYNPDQARISAGHVGGGRFGSKITPLLEHWLAAGGKGDPLGEAGVSRQTIVAAAKAHGVEVPPRMPLAALKAALYAAVHERAVAHTGGTLHPEVTEHQHRVRRIEAARPLATLARDIDSASTLSETPDPGQPSRSQVIGEHIDGAEQAGELTPDQAAKLRSTLAGEGGASKVKAAVTRMNKANGVSLIGNADKTTTFDPALHKPLVHDTAADSIAPGTRVRVVQQGHTVDGTTVEKAVVAPVGRATGRVPAVAPATGALPGEQNDLSAKELSDLAMMADLPRHYLADVRPGSNQAANKRVDKLVRLGYMTRDADGRLEVTDAGRKRAGVKSAEEWSTGAKPSVAPVGRAPRSTPSGGENPFELAPGYKGARGRARQAEREEALLAVAQHGTYGAGQGAQLEALQALASSGYLKREGGKWQLTALGRDYVARKSGASSPAPVGRPAKKATPAKRLTARDAAKLTPAELQQAVADGRVTPRVAEQAVTGGHLAAKKAGTTKVADPAGKPGLLRVLPQVQRGEPGDGSYRNPDGTRGPWGRFGASGLLLRHVGEDGVPRYLMAKRSAGVENGGTWAFPGGALDQHESDYQGATRELVEELGLKPSDVEAGRVHGTHTTTTPGGWHYTSIAATVPTQVAPKLSSSHWETGETRWMTADEIADLDRQGLLHGALGGGQLQANVLDLFPPPPTKAAKQTAPRPTIPTYAPPSSLSAADRARVERLVRADPQIHATTIDRFGPISSSGALRPADAAWLQSVYEREPAYINHVAQDVRVADLIARRATAAGETPEAYKADVAARLKATLADKPIAVRVRDQAALRAILADGRFKTQHEGVKRAPGLGADAARRRLGEAILGVPADAPTSTRPVYGYVAINGVEPALTPGRKIAGVAQREGSKDALSEYGQVQVVLKPGVRSRTTATVGDSLDEIGLVRPSPVDNPSAESLGASSLDSLESPSFTRTRYVEAQIHGGVSSGDIAEVVFADPPDAATTRALDRAGVPWRVLTPHSGAPSAPAKETAAPNPGRHGWGDSPPSTDRMAFETGEAGDPAYMPPPRSDHTVYPHPDAEVRTAVEDAWARVANSTGFAKLADIRDQLGATYPWDQVNRVLRDMTTGTEPAGVLLPESNQQSLTQRDRDARINLGGQTKHLLTFDDAPAARIRARQTGSAVRSSALDDLSEDPSLDEIRSMADDEGIERAAGHDVTLGHDELHHYWVEGEGRHLWVDSPTPWRTLYALVTAAVRKNKRAVPPEVIKTWVSRWFIEAKGYAAGSDRNRVEHGQPPRGHKVGPG